MPDFAADGVYTTGCWYYRLTRAVMAGTGRGSLSGAYEAMPVEERRRAFEAPSSLPEEVGLLGQRSVVPLMATLRTRRPLNMLTAEAIAVALVTNSELRVAADSDLMRGAAAELGIDYRVID